MCVCAPHVGVHIGGKKKALDPLELKLWATQYGFWEQNLRLLQELYSESLNHLSSPI